MSGLPLASVAAALVAAFLFACAAVAQQSAASEVPEDESLIAGLLRNPRWWAGLVGDGGGYAMQILALALGSVLVVQPLLVVALVFALPLAARFSGRPVTPRAWALAAALTIALAVFLVVGNPTEGNADAPFSDWAVPLAILLGVVAATAALGLSRANAPTRALALGTASGLLYGLAAAVTKYVTDLFEHGLGTVLTSWQTYALVASGAVGVYLQQKAFQVGDIAASLPAVTVAEPLGAVFVGITVLDERLDTDDLGILATAVAVVVMLAATVALSRAQGRAESAVATAP